MVVAVVKIEGRERKEERDVKSLAVVGFRLVVEWWWWWCVSL